MEKKLQDLIDENYEYEQPRLLFSEESLVFQVLEEETCRGSFTMHTEDNSEVRGIIGCGSPHMSFSPDTFHAPTVTVNFTYTAAGQKEGEPERGSFLITSSVGEYVLPFAAEPLRHYFRSFIGEIRTLNDFSNLAKLNREEALSIFQNRYFPNLFLDAKTNLLYRGLCYRGTSSAEMEEFLIGTGKKSRIQFHIETGGKDLGIVKSIRVESIAIERSGWGAMDLVVSTDAPFLQLKQERLTQEDFAEGCAEAVFMVRPEAMHAGINIGEVRISSAIESWSIPVRAKRAQQASKDPEWEGERYRRRAHYLLEQYYMNYHLEGTGVREWAKSSIDVLDRLIERNPSHVLYFLMKCHVLIASENPVDAEWILNDASAKLKKKYTPLWCYAQYLDSCLHKDPDQTQLKKDITEASGKYPGDLLLMWLKNELILQESEQDQDLLGVYYANIRRMLAQGAASPILFLDAFRVIRENTKLAAQMEEEEQRIFFWAAKHNLLTKKTASFVVSGAGKVKNYSDRYFWLLGRCYRILKSDVCVRAICTYLIKNNRYGEKYLIWFARGLERRMRIAGICEAYIQSWHKKDGDIPWKVLQYFSKRTALPSVYRARIYAYAVRSRSRIGREWHAYERLIGDFVIDELKKGHMSDDIAELCRYILAHDETRAGSELLTCALSSCKVTCTNDVFASAVICSEGREKGEVWPLTAGTAFVRIGDEPTLVLFEDSHGRRFSPEGFCRISRVFPDAVPGADPAEAGPQRCAPECIENTAETDASPEEEEFIRKEAGELSFASCIDDLAADLALRESAGEDVLDLKVQLFERMIFTGHFCADHAAYFREVCRISGTESLRDAYVSWFAWRYLYAGESVPEDIFPYIEYRTGLKRKVGHCLETALLKYYCENGWSGPQQEKFVRQHLERNLKCGAVYPFYEKLPESVRRRYLIFDIRCLSISYLPGRQMQCEMIFGSRGHENRRECTMNEVFPGLYVAAVRLFASEKTDYMIYEMQEGVVETGSLGLSPREIMTAQESRYQALNEALEEAAVCTDKLKKYAELSDMTRLLFKPIKES